MASIQTRKTKSGDTKYRAQIRIKGFPTQTATFDRKTDAKEWAKRTESAMKEGRYFKQSEAKRHTLSELIERYIQQNIPSKKDQHNQTLQLNWWNKRIGTHLLSDLTPALLAEQRDFLLNGDASAGKKRSPATVNRYLAILSHAFTIAVKEWGWMEENPLKKVNKLKESRGRVRYLSDSERDALIKACKDSDSPYLHLVVVLALATGMRLGEIMNLKWSNIDFDRKSITLETTKNDERRVLHMTPNVYEMVQEHSRVRRLDTNLLFPSTIKPEIPIDLRKPWLKALNQAGIEDFRFHDLRHSAASYLAMNGASPSVIAAILGHKTLQMVKRYAHLSDEYTAEALTKMNERIFN